MKQENLYLSLLGDVEPPRHSICAKDTKSLPIDPMPTQPKNLK
jgi:hypothetical protein